MSDHHEIGSVTNLEEVFPSKGVRIRRVPAPDRSPAPRLVLMPPPTSASDERSPEMPFEHVLRSVEFGPSQRAERQGVAHTSVDGPSGGRASDSGEGALPDCACTGTTTASDRVGQWHRGCGARAGGCGDGHQPPRNRPCRRPAHRRSRRPHRRSLPSRRRRLRACEGAHRARLRASASAALSSPPRPCRRRQAVAEGPSRTSRLPVRLALAPARRKGRLRPLPAPSGSPSLGTTTPQTSTDPVSQSGRRGQRGRHGRAGDDTTGGERASGHRKSL
jgi:hypothetical protein